MHWQDNWRFIAFAKSESFIQLQYLSYLMMIEFRSLINIVGSREGDSPVVIHRHIFVFYLVFFFTVVNVEIMGSLAKFITTTTTFP